MVVVTRTPEYLEHHGIQGQKWGVKNGPPYPLDYEQHNSSEKSKNPKGSLDNYVNNNPKSRVSSSNTERPKRSTKTGEVNDKNSQSEKVSSKKVGRQIELSEEDIQKHRETTKKVIIAAAVTIGIGAACYVAYKQGAVDYIKKGLEKAAKDGVNLNKSQLKNLSQEALDAAAADVDWTIKQGDVMHRMHAWKDFDLSKTVGKGTYVTVTDADRAGYMKYLKDWHNTGERYDISLKAARDLVVPSETHARELFEQFYNSNPDYQKKLFDTVASAYAKMYKKAGFDSQTANLQATMHVKGDLQLDKFKTGVYSIVKGGDDSKMLFDMYRKAGYNAVVDYFDKGTMGEMPVILFDANKDVVITGSSFVTDAMKKNSTKILKKAVSHPLHKYAVAGY